MLSCGARTSRAAACCKAGSGGGAILANGMMLGSKLPTASTTDGFQNAWVVSWVAPVHEHRTFPRVADKLTIKISQRGIGILQCEVCFWILTPDPPEQCRFGILSKDPPVQRQNCPDPPVWKFTPQVHKRPLGALSGGRAPRGTSSAVGPPPAPCPPKNPNTRREFMPYGAGKGAALVVASRAPGACEARTSPFDV